MTVRNQIETEKSMQTSVWCKCENRILPENSFASVSLKQFPNTCVHSNFNGPNNHNKTGTTSKIIRYATAHDSVPNALHILLAS